ncbi:MAG: Gfo/Idh/MocA family oxidoreductase [Acidimicrobiales bacterium]
MTHRVGIIGLGTVGSRFVEQFSLHPAFEVVAAWDPDPSACDARAHAVDIKPGPTEVIDAADMVYIAVPPLFHGQYVEACIAAGKAIFCEKPLGIDVAASRKLVDDVSASGLPAAVNFVFGAAPSALRLVDAVERGELGEIVRCDLRLHFAHWPRIWHQKAAWLALRDQGGWIREVVSHFLFLAGRLLGPLTLEHSSVSFPDGTDGVAAECDAVARLTSDRGPLTMIGTSEESDPTSSI